MLTRKEIDDLRVLTQEKYRLQGRIKEYELWIKHDHHDESINRLYRDRKDELAAVQVALNKLLIKCGVSI